MNAQIITITPEKATEMLKGNTVNREKNKAYISGLSQEMKNGNWMLTGEPIIISKEGVLLDGQHRLEAVILANVPVDFFVVRGADVKSFRYIDTGKSRSVNDLLHIEGLKNVKKTASVAKAIIGYEIGLVSITKTGVSFEDKVRTGMTNADILDYIKANETLLTRCTSFAYSCYTRFNALRIPEYGLLFYLLGNIDESDAKTFLSKLSSGSDLPEGSAMLALRNKFIDARVNRRSFSQKVKLGMIFKCWNLFRQGRVKGKVYLDVTEELPTLI